MKIRKSHVSIGLLFLILSLTVTGTLNQSVKPQYKLETPRASAGEITIVTPENKTYMEPDSGYYPGTFGFENEADGTSRTNIAYVDSTNSIQSNCYVDIVNNFQGHNKVLRIYDQNTAGNAEARNHFTSPQQTGTIEWWWSTSASGSNMIDYLFYEGILGTGVGKLKMEDGNYLDMQDSIVQSYIANRWYHHRIEFDAASDTYNWSIDGILRVNNGNFLTPVSNIGTMNINADWANYGSCYVDAVGYSWDPNYNVGDNLNEGLLVSYENTTTLDWTGYSLDGQANNTILGNRTLPMPADGVHSIQVFGNDSVGTIYESQVNFFSVRHINIITPEAKVYSEPDSGYYPATYGFENDLDNSYPTEFFVEDDSAGTVQVISGNDGHQKVLEIYDSTANSDDCIVTKDFPDQVSGTIEFWSRITKVTGGTVEAGVGSFIFGDGDLNLPYVNSIFMKIENGRLKYMGPSWVSYTDICAYSANRWYHFKIEFDCSSDWHLWLDGVSMDNGTGYGYLNNPVDLDNIRLHTEDQPSDYSFYFDAFGFGWDSDYNIGDNMNEGLLLSYENTTNLDWQGYSLDGQTNKTILGNTTIPMPFNGAHNIQVFGNNSIGTMYESDARYFTIDTLGPDITINSPISSQLYGTTPPDFSLSIPDSDLDAIWYSLDGGTTNIPFSGLSGTIDQTEWDKMGNGTVTITFYANDTANNIGQAVVTVRKDIIAPVITIILPTTAEEFDYTPIFDLTIAEGNLDAFWYTIDNGANNYTISSLTGTINQTAWDAASDGPVTIRFYARDDTGNIGTNSVIVAKIPSEQPTPTPPGIPGYDLYLLIGALSVISAILIRKRLKS